MGLSAVDQIIKNDPAAYGTIDVLCNKLQTEVFTYDPRINRIIQTDITFFPSCDVTTWYKAIMLGTEAATVVNFLQRTGLKAPVIHAGDEKPGFPQPVPSSRLILLYNSRKAILIASASE